MYIFYLCGMDATQLKDLLQRHELTYSQFADELNTFCKREVISPRRKEGMISDWVAGRRNIGPALQFAIEQFFAKR